MEGTTRLINQIVAVVKLIPKKFELNRPNNFKVTWPRNPKSANAMDGMMANIKKQILTDQNPCHHKISTPNKRNNR
jgi:hypothetical protein